MITSPEGLIEYVNPAFETITGFERAEILGRDLHVLDSGRTISSGKPEEVRAEASNHSLTALHARNFLDCMRSRESCIAPAETAHRSITPGHLAYVSSELQRTLKWDAENEVVKGDAEANELLQKYDYRKFL